MTGLNAAVAGRWRMLAPRFLPFADVATPDLPLSRLLRLSLFQVSVGMAIVLLIGTLNRVMIVELGVPAWLVAVMISFPLLFAPFRALVGFRSDHHRSVLGWRRVPYIWIGTLLQFGGLSIMPFALIVLSGDSQGPAFVGQLGAGLAFLLVGAGLHTTQTVGLALATDLAPPETRSRVVATMGFMLLAGMVVSAIVFGWLLAHFSEIRLIQVVQGAAVTTLVLNGIALWKQEARGSARTALSVPRPSFAQSWQALDAAGHSTRRLVAIALGTVGFSMQDVLLEPYGGQILHLPVAATTALTALLACGGVAGFALTGRRLRRDADPYRVAALGTLVGLLAFCAVIFAAPFDSTALFAAGTLMIGFGAGLFAAGTLSAAMALTRGGESGLSLGAWGAAQASAAGVAIACGGVIRDLVASLAESGALGPAMASPASGYVVVYQIEIALLFATLVAIGPLVRAPARPRPTMTIAHP